jgi:uncharacterized protein
MIYVRLCTVLLAAIPMSPVSAQEADATSPRIPLPAEVEQTSKALARAAFSWGQEYGSWITEAFRTAAKRTVDGQAASSGTASDQTFDKSDPAVIEKMTAIAFEAARRDDLKTIDAYLREGFSANIRNKASDTLLSVAAYQGSKAVVKRLLEDESIDVDAPGRMGLTALAAASFKGEVEVVDGLLAAGADANAANAQGQTALMFAALTNRVACFKKLLAAGADPRHQDVAGNSAKSLATQQRANEILALLR